MMRSSISGLWIEGGASRLEINHVGARGRRVTTISLAYSSTKARCHIQRRSSRNDRRTIRNLVDGKPQSYSDLTDVAIASAELIKSHDQLSEVAVRDMKIGEITPVSYKLGII
jgi:hypothetical protein